MDVTLSLDKELVRKVRKLEVERDTTLTGLIRAYLEKLVEEVAASARKRRQREALLRSFRESDFRVGPITWKHGDLYERK